MKFQVKPYDIEKFAESGHGYIKYEVLGFWSDPVEICVSRRYGKKEWSYEVMHSSGGKDSDYDYLEAEENFAHAVLHACGLVKQLKAQEDKLDASYARYKSEMEEHYLQERLMREKAMAADPGFEESKADEIIEEMYEQAKNNPYNTIRKSFFIRTEDNHMLITCEKMESKTVWMTKSKRGIRYMNRVSKKMVKHILMNEVSSIREVIPVRSDIQTGSQVVGLSA